jgi:hypothetical protein
MNTSHSLSQTGLPGRSTPALKLRLAGSWRVAAIIAWGLITLASLVSLALSVTSLNVWDRVPAAQQSRYYPELTAQDIKSHTDYQNVVLQAGFSLTGYAFLFSALRVVGGLALFVVGFLLVKRYSDRLMTVLMATLLSVFAAAGLWGNTLFSWGVSLAPWMQYPAALLGWLLWCGLIVLFVFPDDRFTPRWTLWLALLLVPLTLFLAFDFNFFLNPGHWPNPLDLLPNVLFIGAGFFAILYRYGHTADPDRKRRLRPYVLGLSLLMGVYYVDFLMNEIYFRVVGQPLIRGLQAGMTYVLVYEPVWYALQIFFAIGLAVSVFRRRLLEDPLESSQKQPA